MTTLEFIAIFLAPVIGLKTLKEKDLRKEIISYLTLVALSNLIVNIFIYLIRGYTYLVFTNSFFVKYTIINIITSLLLVYLKLNVRIKIRFKNEK